MTLSDEAEVYYMISVAYAPESAQGFRWSDPAFAIDWPMAPIVISPRDAAYPLLDVPAAP
jgi:dTDP-4-dehydrorhamnose 3,5-epimerase